MYDLKQMSSFMMHIYICNLIQKAIFQQNNSAKLKEIKFCILVQIIYVFLQYFILKNFFFCLKLFLELDE